MSENTEICHFEALFAESCFLGSQSPQIKQPRLLRRKICPELLLKEKLLKMTGFFLNKYWMNTYQNPVNPVHPVIYFFYTLSK